MTSEPPTEDFAVNAAEFIDAPATGAYIVCNWWLLLVFVDQERFIWGCI